MIGVPRNLFVHTSARVVFDRFVFRESLGFIDCKLLVFHYHNLLRRKVMVRWQDGKTSAILI
jgi:hypothetical protein